MNARTSWSAKADRRSVESKRNRAGDADLPLDDLLDARFDEEGRLAQIGRGNRQRVAERLDPRPPAMSADELERAVQKLAQGLEAIERQGSGRRQAPSTPQSAMPEPPISGEPRGRDFVTYSLDRLEARLEALSKRLQQRAATPAATEPSADAAAEARPAERRRVPNRRTSRVDPPAERWRGEPSFAAEPEPASAEAVNDSADADADEESARLAAVNESRRAGQEARRAEAEQKRLAAAEEDARRAEEVRRAEAERIRLAAADDARRAEEARRAEAERMRLVAAEEGRRAAEEEARRVAKAESARRAELDARHQAELAQARTRAEAAEAERQAQAAAALEMRSQFGAIESRIGALQQTLDENQIEPVRNELLEMLQHMQELGRDGRSIAGAVGEVRAKLDDMESKLNAARNMTGNRIGELQDRLSGLTERLGEIEVEVPGFDALRENQTAILERFDRIEGIVHRLVEPEELLERVEGLRRHLQTLPAQREVARIEEQILNLADRVDALPEELSDHTVLEKIETQLAALTGEFVEARRQRNSGEADLNRRLADLSSGLDRIEEADHAPDLSGLDERLADITARLEDDRRFSGDALSRLDKRLSALGAAIEQQEEDASAEILAGLTKKIDTLAAAIEAQDSRGARRDIGALDRKLDQLSQALAGQAEHLSPRQFEPLAGRLDAMQTHLQQLSQRAEASTAQFGPFAQRLQDIAERLSGLGTAGGQTALAARLAAIEERLAGLLAKGPDQRAVHNQLESIVSRLELLKGRSIDPARLTELFDRVDSAIRSGSAEERLERIEHKIAETAVPVALFERLERRIADTARAAGLPDERFARIEQKLDQGARSAISDERFARIEQKLDELGGAPADDADGITSDDIADLRTDIISLRRELRSLPGLGDGEANLGAVLRTISAKLDRLPEDPPATAIEIETQIERVAQLLEDPGQTRGALAQIEASLRSIEERLEETRRAVLSRPAHSAAPAGDAEAGAVAGLARSLSDDVTVLKSATQASEKKTRDALEAVQGTLEAVVKRMAFLERDADAVASVAREPDPVRVVFPPVAPPVSAPARPAARIEPPALAAEPPILGGEAPAIKPEPAREPASGLFSRLTSSQLLKRATGGRAESFTPDQDEPAEAGDLPLEPGTDSPLNSALTGAPSSDTAHLSGSRKGKLRPIKPDSGLASTEPSGEDDFLAAARRAAKAAVDETMDDEDDVEAQAGRLSRIGGMASGRRRILLGGALAVAVAIAAVQLLRPGSVSDDTGVAVAPPAEIVNDEAMAPAPQPETTTAEAVAPPSTPEVAEAPSAPVVAEAPTSTPAPTPTPTPEASLRSEEPVETAAPGAEPSPAARVSTSLPAGSLAGERSVPAPEVTAALESAPPAAEQTPADQIAPAGPAAETAAPSAGLALALPEEIGPAKLRDAAAAGDAVAEFEVGARYAEGRGVPADMANAVAWYERAANAGMAPAQYRLGSIYEKGLGIPKDLTKAQAWYGRAADAGNVKAMHNLAVLFAEGAGGHPDLEQAAKLFRQAAEHGVRDSQFNLAILHARGLGVPQDMVEAYKWFAIAATSGDEESAKRRDIIAAALSEEDLEKAKAAAESFQPLPLIAEANDVMMPEGGWGQSSTAVGVKSENDLVVLVQKLLAEKGYDPGPTDGLLGKQTIQAITSFQEKKGLPTTGQIDTGLVAALSEQST